MADKIKISARAIASAIMGVYTGDNDTETHNKCRHLWLANREGDEGAMVVGTDGRRLYAAGTYGDMPKAEVDKILPIRLARAVLASLSDYAMRSAVVEIGYTGEPGKGEVTVRLAGKNIHDVPSIFFAVPWEDLKPVDWRRVIPTKFEACDYIGFDGGFMADMAASLRVFLGGDKAPGLKLQLGGKDAPALARATDKDGAGWLGVVMPMHFEKM